MGKLHLLNIIANLLQVTALTEKELTAEQDDNVDILKEVSIRLTQKLDEEQL